MLSLCRSIAVIGPEYAGKEFISRKIAHRSGRLPYLRGPVRHGLRTEYYPEMGRYVLSIYSGVDDLSIDLSENVGLIVFNFNQVAHLDSWDAISDYQLCFESLEKAVWLGIKDYVVAITHVDLCTEKIEPEKWFLSNADKVTSFLTDGFGIRVHGCVPIGRDGAGNLVDCIAGKRSIDVGPNIADLNMVLKLLISTDRQYADQLWITGKIQHSKARQHFLRINIDASRGRGVLRNNDLVKAYPGEIPCMAHISEKGNGFEIGIEQTYHLDDLEKSGKIILVSSDSDPLPRMVLDVHAILRSGLNARRLENEERNYRFGFFGQEKKKGDIIRIRPVRLVQAIDQPATSGMNRPGSRQHFGDEVVLRIGLRERAVVQLYGNDTNAGRVLIWEETEDSELRFLGAGRIIGFPNLEIEDIVHQLLLLDQLRMQCAHQSQNRGLCIHKFQQIYHASSNTFRLANSSDSKAIRSKKDDIEREFDKLIDDVRSSIEAVDKETISETSFRLVPHLVQAKNSLSRQYDLIDRMIQKCEIAQFNATKRAISHECSEYVDFIRLYSDMPIAKHVHAAANEFSQYGARVVTHNQLKEDYEHYAFYPKNSYILETLGGVIAELFTNSQKAFQERFRDNLEELAVHIFIEPPKAQDPNHLDIFYCDSGLLDTEVAQKFREKIESRRGQFCTDSEKLYRLGAKLGLVEKCIEKATTFSLRIPVWFQGPRRLENILFELVEIMSAIDFEICNTRAKSSLFLNHIAEILRSTPPEDLAKELRVLWSEARNTSEWSRKWSPRISAALSSLSIMEETPQVRKLALYSIEQLLDRPALTSVRNAINTIKKELAFRCGNIELIETDILPHLMESARTFRSLTRTIEWGLREVAASQLRSKPKSGDLKFRVHLIDSGDQKEIEIIIKGSGLLDLAMELLPLQSRLATLDIKTSTVSTTGELHIYVPVQVIR